MPARVIPSCQLCRADLAMGADDMPRRLSFVLLLTQAIVLVDYCAVGAMRTVLPYYAKALGATGQK